MIALLIVLFVIISVLLVFIILIQSNKSGSMGLFGSSESVFGSGGLDVLTKITAGFGIAFVVLAFSISYLMSKGKTRLDTELERLKKQQVEQQVPTPPADENQPMQE